MAIFFIIYAVILFLLLVRYNIPELDKYLTWGVGIFLIVFAGCRGVGTDNDMVAYMGIFDKPQTLAYFWQSHDEFIATALPVLLKYFGFYSYLNIFFIFAIISIAPKLYAINKYSAFPLVSLFIYYCHLFLLQDMTQVRAASAIGVLFLSISDIADRNLFKFLLKVGIACIFHYSSLLFLMFYFFNDKNINARVYVFLLFATLLLALSKINVIGMIPGLSAISSKMATYAEDQTFTVNPLSVQSLINLSIILYQMKYIDVIKHRKYTIILLKLYALSLILFWGCSTIAVLAFRISELISISAIFCIPNLYFIIKSKFKCTVIIISICTIFIVLDLFRQSILHGYFLNSSLGLDNEVTACFNCNGNL